MLNHLAIIMDWNRRWAKEKLLPSVMWHKAWAENVKKIIKLSIDNNISYLTLWALSTDNLNKRWDEEVKWIIKLINSIENYLWDFLKNDIKFETIWNLDLLPIESKNILLSIKERTKNNTNLTLTIWLWYGGQDELVRAVKLIVSDWVKLEDIDKNLIKSYLDTRFLPNPDVIVRTWWDIRHSWFLLFDSEYSEYYFTEKKWPEFDESEFLKAIDFFNKSKRNFWK